MVPVGLRSFRRSWRNGASALALAIVLAALALTLAGVLAGAVVLVFLRRAAALALAGVLARASGVAGLAVAVGLTRVEAFTSMLVGSLGRIGHLDGLRRGLVEAESVR